MRARGDLRNELEPKRDYSQVACSAASADLSDLSESPQPASLTPVLWAVSIASFGALAFGYHLGVVNGPLNAIAADLGFAGNASLQGTVVSSLLAGAAVGSLGGSGLADSLGRKATLLLTSIPLLAGALLAATAGSLTSIVAGRVLSGVGIGLASALVPLYISEIAPTKVRGSLGSINQLVICIGIVAALVVNVVIPATSWRTMFYLASIPPILLAVGLTVTPESPRWLYSKGRTQEAEAAAEKLWGPSGPGELTEGSSKTDVEGGSSAQEPVSMGELLGNKGVRIGCAIFLLQQFSGINAIVYFSSSVFAQAGITNAALASAAVQMTNVLMTMVAASLMDRAGRKQLLTLSFSGMGLSMLAMAAGLGIKQLSGLSSSVAIVGTVAYVVSFALGAGPVPGLLVPEITPARLRGKAVSLALATHWVFNYAIGQLFLPALAAVGVSGVYLFFAFICALTVVFTNSQIVETKGRSLDEIEKLMAK
ncbi:general substrate transporter [Coccomyxa subellipsoidea C-169]|uniref:General substrate transporter n=1 Tax=Coccomyxa subellipsoidea (strain C-169) TaxID=574566 RepID=I0Z4F7_COCSC|nr:general substrate transporter [Coccomyxa subellipsoidea C-169]EIE25526.1 general substrate transporter [Coccomyxa subellipsoidea C-169]|eukprot:XP_005650070.1 general substrate transporter [Coccomyxa subellipsoidea C-169]